jgi:uncharacterized RDD family membrane protein YckC
MDANPYAAPNAALDTQAATAGPARVGFGARLGAWLIDFVVVGVIGLMLANLAASWFSGYLAEAMAQQQAKMDPKVAAQMAVMTGVLTSVAKWSAGTGVAAVFYSLFEGLFGRALGKLLLGLRIADTDGRIASVPRLMARMGVKQCGTFLGLLGMITGIYKIGEFSQIPALVIAAGCFMVFGKKRQALHDLAAKTAVYRNSDVILER